MTSVSLCATVYNSADTVESFLEPLLQTGHETVVVDGGSTDGTWTKLVDARRLGEITPVRRDRWTSRGRGRQIAFDSSTGDVVLQLDANIRYSHLDRYVERYLDEEIGSLVNFGYAKRPHDGGARHLLIGTRNVWNQVGGYRDLFAWEDIDLAQRAGTLYVTREIDLDDAVPLKVKGLVSGESDGKRYATGVLRRMIREAVTLRDQVRVKGVRKGLVEPWKTNLDKLR